MAALTQYQFETFFSTLANNMSNEDSEYAKEVYKHIFNELSEVDENYFDMVVMAIFPIARYVVEHVKINPEVLAKSIIRYIYKYVEFEDYNIKINIDDELKNKYPIKEDINSKLTALACEFVEIYHTI